MIDPYAAALAKSLASYEAARAAVQEQFNRELRFHLRLELGRELRRMRVHNEPIAAKLVRRWRSMGASELLDQLQRVRVRRQLIDVEAMHDYR